MGFFESTEHTPQATSPAAIEPDPGPELAAPFQKRTFTMPCSRAEALAVIRTWPDHEGNRPFDMDVLSGESPPLVETIYMESADENGFVIAAGNRARGVYWRMQLNLAGDDPTYGTFRAVTADNDRWFGNVMRMSFALDSAIDAVGGEKGVWP